MDSKNRKIYNRILDFHEKGEINKALELCEIALGENLGETEILNFKGLMLYERGMLKEAITVWKINVDLNNDPMAKNYIKDAEYDEERIKIYKEAEQALKKSDINKALPLFLECTKSDFNCIKVNTGIAMCYQKKGDYYRAKEYVDKALKIDKNAVTANEVKKNLEGMNLYYGESRSGSVIKKISIVISTIIIMSLGGYFFWKSNKDNIDNMQVNNVEASHDYVNVDETEAKDKNNENNEKDMEAQQEASVNKFDIESLSQDIKDSDFNSIYEKVHNIQATELNANEKNLYDEAVSLLKKDGAENFYNRGLEYFNQKDFNNAKNQFDKAYEYAEGNNLEQHIIFFRGSTASELGDKDLTLEMYKKYDNLYPKGSYIEGVLYELALLNWDIDKGDAREYAQKLIDKYPQSIYVNDRIMNMVNTDN